VRREIDTAAGEVHELKLVLKRAAGPEDVPPPPPVVVARRPLWPALVTGGAAVLLFAAGGGLAGAASGKRANADALRAKLGTANAPCASPPLPGAAADCQAFQYDMASHDTFDRAALGTFVAGGALAAAAAGLGVWAITGPKDDRGRKSSVRIVPAASPGGAVVVGTW
jgi:hypothetical protein